MEDTCQFFYYREQNMSTPSMLEQAVIDAKSLKEAAVKTAEDELLKKYSSQIKEAVESLLEQDEAPLPIDMGLPEEPLEEEEIVQKLELKALDGESNSDLEDGELVEINLDELKEELEAASPALQESDEEEEEEEEKSLYGGSGRYKKNQEDGEEIDNEYTRDMAKAYKKNPEHFNEEVEITEENVADAIEEILKVDYEIVPRGDLGTTHPTIVQQKMAVAAALASTKDTEVKEEMKELENAIKQLTEQVKSIKLQKNKINKDYSNLKKVAFKAAQKLEELNLSNAKLLYQNRILESFSLNERQKKRLVETISNATSINEAKIIFETLNKGIEARYSEAPKNLSEVTSKNNQLILKSNNNASESVTSEHASLRMKKLAGII